VEDDKIAVPGGRGSVEDDEAAGLGGEGPVEDDEEANWCLGLCTRRR
jgi:hypothetical protein